MFESFFPNILSYLPSISLSVLLACAVHKIISFQNELRRAEAELSELENNISNYDDANYSKTMDGIFEIHITISPKKDYVKLLKYVESHKHERKFKLVLAASGTNTQYMLSYFTRKNDDKLAVESATKTAENMEKEGISVSRIKVEAHETSGIPISNKDYAEMSEHLNLKYNRKCGKPYFEFHCKMANPVEKDLDDLEQDVGKYEKCAISYNLCSQNKNPILTIRIYDVGFDNAEKYKDEVMNGLKELGYIFEDKIQEEFAIFDSNPELDHGFIQNKF